MRLNNVSKILIAVVGCEFAGIIGAVFTTPSISTWYVTLIKPALNPPSWIFGPVWTTLYFLMGVAFFLVWKRGLNRKEVRKALYVFGLQLFLNVIWSVLFFGLHNPGLGFVTLVLMWLAIAWTIVLFARISKVTAYLLLPYILWVSFAGYLNYMIWFLN